MARPVVVMDFSGIYGEETFARNPRFAHIDCRHLGGTDCYCDAEGAAAIRRLIAPYPAAGVHFIDSGDYHYVTKFWTEKISEPFSLALFDHHTDMLPSRWGGMLSCGGWVKDVADGNPLLRHVYILGIPEAQVAAIPQEYRGRVVAYGDGELRRHGLPAGAFGAGGPLYVSIDKDVLDTDDARTNWDHGSLSLAQLKEVLRTMLSRRRIIGIDVCGECPATLRLFGPDGSVAIDDKANRELLALFAAQGLC